MYRLSTIGRIIQRKQKPTYAYGSAEVLMKCRRILQCYCPKGFRSEESNGPDWDISRGRHKKQEDFLQVFPIRLYCPQEPPYSNIIRSTADTYYYVMYRPCITRSSTNYRFLLLSHSRLEIIGNPTNRRLCQRGWRPSMATASTKMVNGKPRIQ